MICLIANASDTTWMIRRVIPGSTYLRWVGLAHLLNIQHLSMLNPVFELVSAYGTVGLSLGVPNVCRYLRWIFLFGSHSKPGRITTHSLVHCGHCPSLYYAWSCFEVAIGVYLLLSIALSCSHLNSSNLPRTTTRVRSVQFPVARIEVAV
jgi:hypothetical protein